MSNNFGYLDIILLAMIAGFIILRLRNILGRKTCHQDKVYSGFSDKKFEQFKESSVKGHILLSRYSFEDNQSIIELIDLDNFNVLHKWAPDTDSFFRQMIKRNGQDFLPKHQRFPNWNKPKNNK